MPRRFTDHAGRVFFFVLSLIVFVFADSVYAQQPKLRPLRIALPTNTIAATHFYVGKSLGILARAADEIELATGGLGASVASIQSKREMFRSVVQAVLEAIRVSAT